ncbi:MAG: phosphotransferase [Acidobacteriia bacterium]|nr:phosphotransferase [Terriglobia bacterium]
MIPEAKKSAVARALREAFGVTEFEDIRTLTAGLSPAHVFRIVVRGCPYLLRVVMDTGAAAGPGRGDQTNHYACMKLGAEAGIAPRVWYTSTEDRVSITDFVEARPLPRTEALARLPLTLRALHALPPFSKPKNTISPDAFIRRFQDAKILPESETAELFERYARVTSVYPRDTDMVSCHNDLKPENILFDGDRVWLVDWEAAFLNDRYFDLAIVANFIVTNEAEEETYLRTYFGEPAGEYRLARFYLMRQTMHMLGAIVFMLIGSAGKPIESNAKAPAFRDFHDGIWAGDISLAGNEAKLQYALVHMNQLLENMRTVRFQDALRIVSDRHASA